MTNKIGPVDQSMIGKIGNKIEETGNANRTTPDPGAGSSAAAGRDAARDTVELTSGARLLERLEKSLEALPAVDSARVAEIRSAIERGEYRVDSRAVADAMLRFEHLLRD